MNSLLNPLTRQRFAAYFFMTALMFTLSLSLHAQQPQLTLVDLLIGLRSKKVSLADRNTILAEAVKQRGVTFKLVADIEKELTATGATKNLLDAIREKAPVAPAPTPSPIPVATPIPTPTPPDFSFYQKRADLNLGKGEYTLALADYDKVVELKSDEAVAFLNRGKTHYNLNAFDKAGADYEKAIELDPKGSKAYFNRGVLFERLGNYEKAIVDYQKVVELDASNDIAKTGLKKLQDDQKAKVAAQVPPPVPTPVVETVKVPEFLNLGTLSSVNAVKMVTPSYSTMAKKMNVEGRVTVEVELDDQGNVTIAKAVIGPQFLRKAAEDAARRSKFKPAMFDSKPIKAVGTITYNFTLKPTN